MEKTTLLRSSDLYRSVSTFVDNAGRIGRAGGEDVKADGEESFLSRVLSDLTVMRIITLAIMFFLVQVLVRLYQYSLRLAAFWESRSDAILLAPSFADGKARTFEELVSAISPDSYDFKPGPRSFFNCGSCGARNRSTSRCKPWCRRGGWW